MLPGGCSRRLVTELQDALDACDQRQRQLERSMRVSRRLLRTWEPAETPPPEPNPGPETNEEAQSPACTPNPQDLRELELLTQALEKAVRVRKGISKAGGRDKAGSIASSANTASAPSWASETKPPRSICQTTVPAKGHPERRLLSAGDRTCMRRGAQAANPGPGLRDQQIASSAAPQAPEAFTLKEKGTLLQLPMAFRKAASQNSRVSQLSGQCPLSSPRPPKVPPGTQQSQRLQAGAPTLALAGVLRSSPAGWNNGPSLAPGVPMCASPSLWAQLSSAQTSDSVDATTASKTQFLQKMQTTSGWPSSGLSAAEVEAEVGSLWKACSLLRLRMEEELATDFTDWMQEYRCLLTLEGLQALVGQCLHRLQELRAAVVEQQLGPWPERRLPRTSLPCGGGAVPIGSPQRLLYSSTQELQTLAALRLRVAMLDQQIHLEKVLMAELLPLISMQEPLGLPWLALCRAVHSLLCEGGERFLTILRDEPAD